MTATAVLADARRVGVRLRFAEDCRVKAEGRPDAIPTALLGRLCEHKAGLVELLCGNACLHCGAPIAWRSDGVAFADGTGAHVACYERADAARCGRIPGVGIETKGEPGLAPAPRERRE